MEYSFPFEKCALKIERMLSNGFLITCITLALGIEDKIESSEVMFHKKGIEASIVNSQKMKAVYSM